MRSFQLYSHDPATRRITWGALAPVLVSVMVVAGQVAGYLLMRKVVPIDSRGNPADAMGVVGLTLLPFGISLALLAAWMRWVEQRGPATIGLVGERKVAMFLRGHALGMASLLVVLGSIVLAGGLVIAGPPRAWSSPQALGMALLLLPCFALQSSVEELLFRGWLLSVMARKINLPIAVLVNATLFAMFHFNPAHPVLSMAGTFVIALFFCAWVLRTRSLWGVMGWHAGWNWLLAVGFDLPLSGIDAGLPSLVASLRSAGPAWLSGGEQGPEGSVVCIVLVAWATLAIWQRTRRLPLAGAEVSSA
jgi:uncharacterized protein